MSLHAKVSGVWKFVTVAIRSSGIWRRVTQMWVRISGVWRPVWTYNWATSDWTACSAPCGGGTQTRVVMCQRDDGVIVSDYICEGLISARPPTQQACNTHSCATCHYQATGSGLRTYWMASVQMRKTQVALVANNVTVYRAERTDALNVTTVTASNGITYTRGVLRDTIPINDVDMAFAYEICY